jgi:hypothetical protein
MSIRGSAGSLIESHRAKAKRPDRRNFLTQTRRTDTDAADAYEHILTIQNATDLEFPAIDPANAPARAEFKLGIFPPDHHVAPAAPTPTPTPATQTPKQ